MERYKEIKFVPATSITGIQANSNDHSLSACLPIGEQEKTVNKMLAEDWELIGLIKQGYYIPSSSLEKFTPQTIMVAVLGKPKS
ncbi:MAG: hypothetical protein V1851_01940 [Patescibacteria group bacterium]